MELSSWELYKSRIPAQTLGDCRIVKFEYKNGPTGPAGTYTYLFHKDKFLMEDTMLTTMTNLKFINEAHGHVLLNGLGLGITVFGLLKKPDVESITVVEYCQDVIDIIKPYITDTRVKIIHDDAWTFKPTMIYDFVWHDIVSGVEDVNEQEMDALEKRYTPYCRKQATFYRELDGIKGNLLLVC